MELLRQQLEAPLYGIQTLSPAGLSKKKEAERSTGMIVTPEVIIVGPREIAEGPQPGMLITRQEGPGFGEGSEGEGLGSTGMTTQQIHKQLLQLQQVGTQEEQAKVIPAAEIEQFTSQIIEEFPQTSQSGENTQQQPGDMRTTRSSRPFPRRCHLVDNVTLHSSCLFDPSFYPSPPLKSSRLNIPSVVARDSLYHSNH